MLDFLTSAHLRLLFPDAWIQVGRFRGLDKSQIEDHSDLRSHLLHAVEDAIAFVHKYIKHGAEIGAVRRTERWELPPVAVREAIINAVVHADYSQRGSPIRIAIFDDRREVENPGILPFGLALEDLPRGASKLRNRVPGRVFRELGLVEQWRSGIQRMMAAGRDCGFPPPTFEEIGARFRVTLWSERAGLPSLDKTDQAIIAIMATDQGRLTSGPGHKFCKKLASN
jgi:ATP-dependent DNA helicase RecG